MYTVKVDFKKTFSPDGTVYHKTLSMPDSIFQDIIYDLVLKAKEAEDSRDEDKKMRLIAEFQKSNNTYFLNLTQSFAVVEYILKQDYIYINRNRAMTPGNTAIRII